MEEADDLGQLLPLSEDPAPLLWLENDDLDLDDLITFPCVEATIESTVDARSVHETNDPTNSDLRVLVRLTDRSRQRDAIKAPAGRASHRQRQKQDIQTLRAHVAELQHELRFLQSGLSAPGPSNAGASSLSTPMLVPSGGSSWRLIAKTQFQARELAEQENRKLRQTLQERIRMAKSLERMLLQHEMIRSNPSHRRPRARNTTSQAKPGPWDSSWIAVTSLPDVDMPVFLELLARVDDSAGDLDAVFKSNGLDRITTEFLDARLKILPTPSDSMELPAMAIEMMDVKILPFDLVETVSAAWRCLTSKRVGASAPMKQWQHIAGLAGRTNVMVMRLNETDRLWRRVMKKIVCPESNRSAFVWETQMLIKESGVLVRQRGWLQFEPLITASDPPQTIARSCRYSEPQLDKEGASDAERIRAREYFSNVADTILSKYEKAVTLTYQAVENILVEESRHGAETTV